MVLVLYVYFLALIHIVNAVLYASTEAWVLRMPNWLRIVIVVASSLAAASNLYYVYGWLF